MGGGRWAVGGGRREVGSGGRWAVVGGGRWEVSGGRWAVGGARSEMNVKIVSMLQTKKGFQIVP